MGIVTAVVGSGVEVPVMEMAGSMGRLWKLMACEGIQYFLHLRQCTVSHTASRCRWIQRTVQFQQTSSFAEKVVGTFGHFSHEARDIMQNCHNSHQM